MHKHNRPKRRRLQRRKIQTQQTDELLTHSNMQGTTPADNILNLQNTIGNQAVMRMMQSNDTDDAPAKSFDTSNFGISSKMNQMQSSESEQPSTNKIQSHQDSKTLQRWDIDSGDIDLGQATEVGTVKSGQAVFFVKDGTGDTMVVKGEDVQIGKTQLAGMLYEQLTDSTSVHTQDITDQKGTLKNILADPSKLTTGWDGLAEFGPPWHKTLTKQNPEWSTKQVGGQFHQDQLDVLPFVQAMDLAKGDRADDLMHGEGERSWRMLMRSNTYMREMGKVTAVDLFLENADRVDAGNLGNWMTIAGTGAITLIDNLDATASNMWSDNDPKNKKGPTHHIDKLAPSALSQTAKDCVDTLITRMKQEGDDSADEWKNEESPSNPGKTRYEMMLLTFEEGLTQGRETLIQILLKKKMKGAGRDIKAAALAASQVDGQTGVDYWTRLKARVRYLKKLK